MHNYIVVYSNNNEIEGEYISLRNAIRLITKYKVYIFKYKRDQDMLYLNYPLNMYYSTSTINNITAEENDEDKIKSFGHLEIRLTPVYPQIRIATNMKDL